MVTIWRFYWQNHNVGAFSLKRNCHQHLKAVNDKPTVWNRLQHQSPILRAVTILPSKRTIINANQLLDRFWWHFLVQLLLSYKLFGTSGSKSYRICFKMQKIRSNDIQDFSVTHWLCWNSKKYSKWKIPLNQYNKIFKN